jgi:uncharacterized protein with ParB-like and HNH nuclease domain
MKQIDPKAKHLIDLLGDQSVDRYFVPTFQRDFTWAEENVRQLWADLSSGEGEGDDVYLGNIILYRPKTENIKPTDEYGLGTF